MCVKMSMNVEKVVNFMKSEFHENELRSIARELARVAPKIWENYSKNNPYLFDLMNDPSVVLYEPELTGRMKEEALRHHFHEEDAQKESQLESTST